MSEPPPNEGRAYRAFISYSHRDKAWAGWLHKSLEMYRVPSRLVGTKNAHGVIPRRLYPVFRDREELASADELGRTVNEALGRSDNLIVVCSPASAVSRWVNEEVLAYKRMGRGERIFCLIVGGEPDATDMPGREAEECFCPALRFQLDANGQLTGEPSEPIAADARPGKDGKANAKLKLIAGMLGVGFDALKQREQQRRIRRMTVITAVAMGVMALTIVLAVFALISRHEALIAEQTAQRRQKQAEGLVNYMLGELSDQLAKVGRIDIMAAVDKKALAYFSALPSTDVNDTTLEERAKALELLGSQLPADPDELEAYRASARISSRLAAAAPHNIARQIAYSRTLTFIGDTYMDMGELAEAQRVLELARRVLQPSAKLAPDNLLLLTQRVYVENDLGDALNMRGQSVPAKDHYVEMLALSQKLAAARPDSDQIAQALGYAHFKLGRLALQQGNLATAIAEYSAYENTEARAAARNVKDNEQRDFALAAQATLGATLSLAGDTLSAMRDLQQAVDGEKQLAQADPENDGFRENLGVFSTELAAVKRVSGGLAAAAILDAHAVSTFAEFVKRDPTDQDHKRNYAEALVEHALELQATGKRKAAIVSARSALSLSESLLAKNPRNLDARLSVTRTKLLLASLGPDKAGATELCVQALQDLDAALASKNDPRLTALEVEALLALNRSGDAQPLITQLWTEGYRDAAFVTVLQRAHIAYPVNPAFQAKLQASIARAPEANVTAPAATKGGTE